MDKEHKNEVGLHVSIGSEPVVPNQLSQFPLHLLLLSDLTPQSPPTEDWAKASLVTSVNNLNFSDFLEKLCPKITIDIPNYIVDSNTMLELNLSFPNLKTFRPEGVVKQVPVLNTLYRLRELVGQVKYLKTNLHDFKEKAHAIGVETETADQIFQLLSKPAAPSGQKTSGISPAKDTFSKHDRVDSLLSMVEFGDNQPGSSSIDTSPPPPDQKSGLIQTLFSAINQESTTRTKIKKSVAHSIIDQLDQLLGKQMNAVLHHPKFKSLEAAWLSLKFLVDRINFKENIQLSILPVSKENVNEALYHQILMPVHNQTVTEWTKAPFSAIIADYEFSCTNVELEQLEDLADTMARLQVPMIAGVNAQFFGKDDAAELTRIPVIQQHMTKSLYVYWNAFRDKPISIHLCLLIPNFLLRYPYGTENPVEKFDFTESGESHLWGNGAIAIATAIARSFVETAWPSHITGAHNGEIDDLPTCDYTIGGKTVGSSLNAIIHDSKLKEFNEAGFATISCRPNRDDAFISADPMIKKPIKYQNPDSTLQAKIESTLAYRLCAARISAYLFDCQQNLQSNLSADLERRNELHHRHKSLLVLL